VQPTGWAHAPAPLALSPEPSIAESHQPGRRSIVVRPPPLAGPQNPVSEFPLRAFARSRELLTLARRVAMVCAPAKNRRSLPASVDSGPLRPPPGELPPGPELRRLRFCWRYPTERVWSWVRHRDRRAELKNQRSKQKYRSPYKAPKTRSASGHPETCRTGAALDHRNGSLLRGRHMYVRLPVSQYQVQIRANSREGAVSGRLVQAC
jgi:hypothetical protein